MPAGESHPFFHLRYRPIHQFNGSLPVAAFVRRRLLQSRPGLSQMSQSPFHVDLLRHGSHCKYRQENRCR